MRALLFLFVVTAACASGPEAVTWDDAAAAGVTPSDGQKARKDPDAFLTDDACVAYATEVLPESTKDGATAMRGCLHRDDFMLTPLLAKPPWDGLKLDPEKDWPAVLRAELRRGGIAEMNLAPYKMPALWLHQANAKPAQGEAFLLYAEAVTPKKRGAIAGVVVHPILYGTRDEIASYLQHWDLVRVNTRTGQETVVQKDVKVTEETMKTGRVKQLAQTIKAPIFLEDAPALTKGQGYLCIVDRVRAGAAEKGVVREEDDVIVEDAGAPAPIRQIAHVITCVPTT